MRGLVPRPGQPAPARRDPAGAATGTTRSRRAVRRPGRGAGADHRRRSTRCPPTSIRGTAPDDMLAWLAGWMGIALDGHQTAGRQRELRAGRRAACSGAAPRGRAGRRRGGVRRSSPRSSSPAVRRPVRPSPGSPLPGGRPAELLVRLGRRRPRGLRRPPAGRARRDGQAGARPARRRGGRRRQRALSAAGSSSCAAMLRRSPATGPRRSGRPRLVQPPEQLPRRPGAARASTERWAASRAGRRSPRARHTGPPGRPPPSRLSRRKRSRSATTYDAAPSSGSRSPRYSASASRSATTTLLES